MQSFHKEYFIVADKSEVWKALVDSDYIEEWSGASCVMDDKIGTKFEIWNGDCHGSNVEVIPYKKLVQEWFINNWDEASHVTFHLEDKDDTTKVTLIHDGIPDGEFDEIKKGWDEFYLGAIKEFLEY